MSPPELTYGRLRLKIQYFKTKIKQDKTQATDSARLTNRLQQNSSKIKQTIILSNYRKTGRGLRTPNLVEEETVGGRGCYGSKERW